MERTRFINLLCYGDINVVIPMMKCLLNTVIIIVASFVIKKSRGRPKQIKKKEICEECGKEVWDLKKHAIMHRPVQERKSIKCKECDKLFSSYSARYKHYKIKHLGIKQHCDICNKGEL